jgi:hypothetical protein
MTGRRRGRECWKLGDILAKPYVFSALSFIDITSHVPLEMSEMSEKTLDSVSSAVDRLKAVRSPLVLFLSLSAYTWQCRSCTTTAFVAKLNRNCWNSSSMNSGGRPNDGYNSPVVTFFTMLRGFQEDISIGNQISDCILIIRPTSSLSRTVSKNVVRCYADWQKKTVKTPFDITSSYLLARAQKHIKAALLVEQMLVFLGHANCISTSVQNKENNTRRQSINYGKYSRRHSWRKLCVKQRSRMVSYNQKVATYRPRPTVSLHQCTLEYSPTRQDGVVWAYLCRQYSPLKMMWHRITDFEVLLMSSCLRESSRLSTTTWVSFGSSRSTIRPPFSVMVLANSEKLSNESSGEQSLLKRT